MSGASTPIRADLQLGAVHDHGSNNPVAQASIGFAINETWSVEALACISLMFFREGNLDSGSHLFDRALGVRAVATLPLGERWNLAAGLGVAQFRDEVGNGTEWSARQSRMSPLVSLSANYLVGRRWTMGVEVSSFTQAHTATVGLRAGRRF